MQSEIKTLEDTIALGKMGMSLLSEEGKKNRLKTQEALTTAIQVLKRVSDVEGIAILLYRQHCGKKYYQKKPWEKLSREAKRGWLEYAQAISKWAKGEK